MVDILSILNPNNYAFEWLRYPFWFSAINASAALGSIVWVLWRGNRNHLTWAYCGLAASMCFWSSASVFSALAANADTALFWYRMLMAGAIFVPVTFYAFVSRLLKRTGPREKLKIRLFWAVFFLFLLADFTPWFLADARFVSVASGWWPRAQILFYIFFAIWSSLALYGLTLLLLGYRTAIGIYRKQVGFVLLGCAIGWTCGLSNYFLFFGIPIPSLLNVFVSIYVVMIGGAVARYQLFRVTTAVAAGTIIATMADPMFVIDDAGVIAVVNPAACRAIGRTADALLGRPVGQFLPKAGDIVATAQRYPQAAVEAELASAAGPVPVEVTVGAISDPSAVGHVLICHDISQLRRQMDMIESQRRRLNAILNGIGDGVFVVGRDGRVVLTNPVAMRLVGRKEDDDVSGEPFDRVFNFVVSPRREPAGSFVREAIAGTAIAEAPLKTMLVPASGPDLPVSATAAPITGTDGVLFGAVVVFHDEHRERELDKLRVEFVSIASHQLKTPLTAIRWLLEMALSSENGPISTRQKYLIDAALHSSLRMLDLINDLLNVSRIEEGRVAITPESTNVDRLLADAVAEIAPLFSERNISIANTATGLGNLNIDAKLVFQALVNLISNAVKYSRLGGKVTLSGERRPDGVLISVKDEGIGIPASQCQRVFSKFFRADNAVISDTEGTGLGLFIAKSIVESSGGRVWFKSEEGKGSTFFVLLPLAGSPYHEGEHGLEKVDLSWQR
ncbi:MAG: ATP-binding protein [Patescibacteria group bacterium]|nr:ATP-binding protein [Patescibacteria group bacterium]